MIQNKFNLKQKVKSLEKTIKKELLYSLGYDTVEFFHKNFDNEGFREKFIHKWKKRKDKRLKHPILHLSGKLKKSVKIVRFDSKHFVVESNLPYSRFHNDGYFDNAQQVRGYHYKIGDKVGYRPAHTRKMFMPQRKFMGHSYALAQIQRERVIKVVNQYFK